MTRKRRYLFSAAILAACVCIALGVLAMLPPQPGVTKANFDRIEVGMTLDEVLMLIGEPFDEDSLGPHDPTAKDPFDAALTWSNENWKERIHLTFFQQRVLTKDRDSTETVPDKLRRWLHLPK